MLHTRKARHTDRRASTSPAEEEEGCYMGHTSDYVATEPWMYGKPALLIWEAS
jgi:hypothetical protein